MTENDANAIVQHFKISLPSFSLLIKMEKIKKGVNPCKKFIKKAPLDFQ